MTRRKLSICPSADNPEAPEPDAASIFAALFAAAQECAAMIGMPVVIEDDALHDALKGAGLNLTTPARQQAARRAGFTTFPQDSWHYHAPELRVISTGPADPRPVEAWDEHLWLSPARLLQHDHERNIS